MLSRAEDPTSTSADRVRHSRPICVNEKIERQTESNVQSYANSSPMAIKNRTQEFDQEWDVERVLKVNASTLVLAGFALGVTVDRRWVAMPESCCRSCFSMACKAGTCRCPFCATLKFVRVEKMIVKNGFKELLVHR